MEVAVHWRNCPPELLDEVRLAALALINGEPRPTNLKYPPVQMRGRLGAGRILATVRRWMHVARRHPEKIVAMDIVAMYSIRHE
ncbi:hypothetical protein [Streptomyces sp. NPDC005125]